MAIILNNIKTLVGGGSVETCTVTLNANGVALTRVTYVCLENGQQTYKIKDISSEELTDVVKNTVLSVANAVSITSDNVTLLNAHFDLCLLFVAGDGSITLKKPCFVKGTKIVLADETTKPVEDITHDDVLLVWDFDNGCYAYAKPIWIMKQQVTSSYYRCTFSDGTVLNLVGADGKCHRVYNADDNRFDHATDCIGKNVYTMEGIVMLVSCEIVEETVEFYNIITENHINLFAEGVLTSCRLNNLYDIHDMRFVKDGRAAIPMEAYKNVDERLYHGLRLGEQKAEDVPMLNEYVANLKRLEQK